MRVQVQSVAAAKSASLIPPTHTSRHSWPPSQIWKANEKEEPLKRVLNWSLLESWSNCVMIQQQQQQSARRNIITLKQPRKPI